MLKCDSGQPSSELTQAGAGLETVEETIPVSNGSREIESAVYFRKKNKWIY